MFFRAQAEIRDAGLAQEGAGHVVGRTRGSIVRRTPEPFSSLLRASRSFLRFPRSVLFRNMDHAMAAKGSSRGPASVKTFSGSDWGCARSRLGVVDPCWFRFGPFELFLRFPEQHPSDHSLSVCHVFFGAAQKAPPHMFSTASAESPGVTDTSVNFNFRSQLACVLVC